MKSKLLLVGVFLAILLKQAVWTAVVPTFQTPDEQAHFAQLQWYAENKNINIDSEKNLSLEVATAEEMLGTRRDGQGRNKFTYHPEYKNNSVIPPLPVNSRTVYVDREAAGYPPLYYVLSTPLYNAVYSHDLVDRVMVSRVFAVLCHLALVICAYFIGKTIWGDKLKSAALATLIGFQPMVSYVAAGIHPDNLLNLLYSLCLLVLLLVLKNGVKFKYLLYLFILVFLGWETKPIMAFVIPVCAAVVLFRFSPKLLPISLLVLVAPEVAFVANLAIPLMPHVGPESPLASMTLVDYLKFRLPKIAFEMWPWYWGVFKWLGVTLPPIVMKIITRLAIISAIGLIINFFLAVKTKKFNFELVSCSLFLVSSAFYILYLILWDWRLMQSMGYSQGLQGRYLFPNIVPHLAILFIGLTTLGRLIKLEKVFILISIFLAILLNIIALNVVIQTYY